MRLGVRPRGAGRWITAPCKEDGLGLGLGLGLGSDSGDSDCGFAAQRLLLGVTAPHCSSHATM